MSQSPNFQVLFNEEEAKLLDEQTIRERKISGTLLMGFAAISIFQTWEEVFRSAKKITILCGSGNNGGDGYALAQFLKAEGLPVEIYSKEGNFSEETKYYKNLTEQLKIPNFPLEKFKENHINSREVLVDSLLGTGFKGPLSGEISKAVAEIRSAKERLKDSLLILSIDAVSGYSPDEKIPFAADILADIGSPKIKNVFYPLSKDRKSFHPIGFLRQQFQTSKYLLARVNKEELASKLSREKDSHKYKNGSAVFIGGSEGMSGAILSSALAFQELGGGISQILTPSANTLTKVLKKDPSFMVSALESSKKISDYPFLKKASVVCVGPGLASSDLPQFSFSKETILIFDAGALKYLDEKHLGPRTILTPHLGEWSFITGKKYQSQYSALEDANIWAKEKGTYLLLKGPVSILFTPEGNSYFWEFQEPKLAVMGTGDLLVGILTFFLSKGEDIVESVRLSQSVLLYCAELCKGYPTAGRIRKKIRTLIESYGF
ncbi:bifunctional ADP-dependent (S)-NAD(P)H-hydrate dehydratase/NAD(P)H-hydrate epimerase [Leptospira hartskeerlii]|uniref:Bifunctional NAD(P)H-hydrate repair enzyme n=1 Tax=Leptospira hartskeerlii TaxID=2023177 RepID=A0A2M9X971_9LEPT|nr:bifunctional ADP-dependent NAD(P)H-hydrate dehydratase/NAD(P)H-hydrate epimerase [Leptospira hartskeerlii]PJZ24227.1 bifunctional ADP-dependent (S)-NAD(P)H-hydrate dehydratase/NAD(P)H-hydrate epimerase [Leptospira hartskeerlii]PJZ32412.1 bifunctional ADP-dependent (S)-NAD(P)H-hydrate dehydratase/NAD(P)H-hydrate epimerase [Leptospira hartskeerlii]